MVYNTNYKDEHWDVIGGLNLQQFRGNHWGYLTYIANQDAEKKFFGSNGQYKYYDSDATSTTTAPSSRQAIALQTTGMPSLTCSIAV